MIIYCTTNLINGKKYIGKDVCNNPNYLGSGVLLKKSIIKYGKENFLKEILEECNSKEMLNDREKYWIVYHNAVNSSEYYNLRDGGDGGDTFTNNPNKELIRSKRTGVNNNAFKNLKGKSYEEIYGIERALELKESCRLRNLGKKQTVETIEKRIKHFKDIERPYDVRRKISKAHLGKIVSESTKEKQSIYRKGKTYEELFGLETSNKIKEKKRNRSGISQLSDANIVTILDIYYSSKELAQVKYKLLSEQFNVSLITIPKIINKYKNSYVKIK